MQVHWSDSQWDFICFFYWGVKKQVQLDLQLNQSDLQFDLYFQLFAKNTLKAEIFPNEKMESIWFWWRYFKPVHREWTEDKRHLEILPAKCTFPPPEYSLSPLLNHGILWWELCTQPPTHARLVWIQTQPPPCAQSIVWCRFCRPEREWHHQQAAISPRVQAKLRFMAEIRVASELSGGLSRRSSGSRCNLNLRGYKCFFPTCQNPPSSRRHSRPCPDNTLTHSHTHTLTHSHLRRRTNLHSIFSRLSARQPRRLRLCLRARV